MKCFDNLNMRLCVMPLNSGFAITNSLIVNLDSSRFQSCTQFLKFNMNIFWK